MVQMLHMLSTSISKVFNDFTQSLGNDFMITQNIATRSWQKSLMVTGCFTLGTTVTEVHFDPSFAPVQSHIRNYVLVNLNPK